MIKISSTQKRNRPKPSWAFLALPAVAALFLGGCAGTQQPAYQTVAYQPASLNDVEVKVSLSTQNVYVEEGGRLLMATPTCVGRPGFLTPTGNFKVIFKDQFKRSETYGYWVRGSEALPGKASEEPAGGDWTYIGYPMAYWVEFAPGFGFHEGPIWPYPRSHGCLHLHDTASAKFFQLVQLGTPVEIAQTLPEDTLYGKDVKRPTDYADPDPPAQLMISQQFFQQPRDSVLLPIPPSQG
jgi:lipoprotein-anchoring transpeptidase ErfK/SrfK